MCDAHNTVCDQVQSVYSQPILIVLGPIGWSRLTPPAPCHNLPSVSRPLSRFGGPARLTILNPPHTLHYLLRLIIFISTHTQTRRQCVRSPGTDGIMPRYPPRILSTYGPARMSHPLTDVAYLCDDKFTNASFIIVFSMLVAKVNLYNHSVV